MHNECTGGTNLVDATQGICKQSAAGGMKSPHEMNKLPEYRPPCLTSFSCPPRFTPSGKTHTIFSPYVLLRGMNKLLNLNCVVLKLSTGMNVNEIQSWCVSSSRWKDPFTLFRVRRLSNAQPGFLDLKGKRELNRRQSIRNALLKA